MCQPVLCRGGICAGRPQGNTHAALHTHTGRGTEAEATQRPIPPTGSRGWAALQETLPCRPRFPHMSSSDGDRYRLLCPRCHSKSPTWTNMGNLHYHLMQQTPSSFLCQMCTRAYLSKVAQRLRGRARVYPQPSGPSVHSAPPPLTALPGKEAFVEEELSHNHRNTGNCHQGRQSESKATVTLTSLRDGPARWRLHMARLRHTFTCLVGYSPIPAPGEAHT